MTRIVEGALSWKADKDPELEPGFGYWMWKIIDGDFFVPGRWPRRPTQLFSSLSPCRPCRRPVPASAKFRTRLPPDFVREDR
jgi:hypothetical protein